MHYLKCDICKKEIIEGQPYYEISEISYHDGKNLGSQMITNRDGKDIFENTESWISYADQHYHTDCFLNSSIKEIIRNA